MKCNHNFSLFFDNFYYFQVEILLQKCFIVKQAKMSLYLKKMIEQAAYFLLVYLYFNILS